MIIAHRIIIIASFFIVGSFGADTAFAQYYRYVDQIGTVHLTNDYNSEACKKYVCTLFTLMPEDEATPSDKRKLNMLESEAARETVVIPNKQEIPLPDEMVVAPASPAAPAAPKIAVDQTVKDEVQVKDNQEIRELVSQWLEGWQSGDMKLYRSCYAANFKSRGMNLNAWIAYKTKIHQKSKDIKITIENLQIKPEANGAGATFIQYYSSSVHKDSGQKKLELIKEASQWKIFCETM